MFTRHLDAVFRATDACQEALPLLLRDCEPGSRLYEAYASLLKASDDFQSHFKVPTVRAEGSGEGVSSRAAA
jgi:hypothetical protein